MILVYAIQNQFQADFKPRDSTIIQNMVFKKWLQNKTSFSVCQSLIENTDDGKLWTNDFINILKHIFKLAVIDDNKDLFSLKVRLYFHSM